MPIYIQSINVMPTYLHSINYYATYALQSIYLCITINFCKLNLSFCCIISLNEILCYRVWSLISFQIQLIQARQNVHGREDLFQLEFDTVTVTVTLVPTLFHVKGGEGRLWPPLLWQHQFCEFALSCCSNMLYWRPITYLYHLRLQIHKIEAALK